MRYAIFLFLIPGMFSNAWSEESLFSGIGSRRAPPDFVFFNNTDTADYDVQLNVMALARAVNPKATIVLKLPGGAAEPIRFLRVERAKCCFIVRGLRVFPDPHALPNEFSFTWFGKGDRDTDVIIAVREGAASGTISGVEGGWMVHFSQLRGQHFVRYIDPAGRPTETTRPAAKVASANVISGPAHTEPGTSESHPVYRSKTGLSGPATKASNDRLLMLILYTDAARIGAHALVNMGVPPAAGDTTVIDSVIANSLDQLNTALINSKIGTARVFVASSQMASYNNSGANVEAHLNWLVGDAGVANLRNQHAADITVMLIEDPLECGVAVTQRKVDCNANIAIPPNSCGVGDEFAPAAFAVVHYACAATFKTFAHEVGHVLGLDHLITINAPPNPPLAERSFPWSAAFRVRGSFQTIVGNDGLLTPQLYFSSSDPTVTFNGQAVGNINADNARTLNVLFPNSAQFRAPAGQVFEDSFEFDADPDAVFDP